MSRVAMVAAASLAASLGAKRPPIAPKEQSPCSAQIIQAIRSGVSLRFTSRCQNAYHGEQLVRVPRPGRNEVCTCGSGKKFKKCCISKT